jgi:hypothetical protein
MPSTKPASAYDWITAEDVVRHALAAYYAACRKDDAGTAAAPDEPSFSDPAHARWANSCRVGLAEQIAQDLELRLLAHAEKQGIKWGDTDLDKFSADTPAQGVSLALRDIPPNAHRAKYNSNQQKKHVDPPYTSAPACGWSGRSCSRTPYRGASFLTRTGLCLASTIRCS